MIRSFSDAVVNVQGVDEGNKQFRAIKRGVAIVVGRSERNTLAAQHNLYRQHGQSMPSATLLNNQPYCQLRQKGRVGGLECRWAK